MGVCAAALVLCWAPRGSVRALACGCLGITRPAEVGAVQMGREIGTKMAEEKLCVT